MPSYVVAYTIRQGLSGVASHGSAAALSVLGGIVVLYLSMISTIAIAALVYAPIVTLVSCVFWDRRLTLISTVVAFVIPLLTELFHFSRFGDWVAAVAATITFGLFCGHIVRIRLV
jgi:hypothetical protein